MRRGIGKQRDLDVTQANVDDIVAQIDQQKASLDDLSAQLNIAKYELDQTVVYAPSDGRGAAGAASRHDRRPFMYRPVMTFIHEDENAYVGWFWQNSMQRLKDGDEAEVVLDGIPGRIFKARVQSVIPAMAPGNVQAQAGLIDQTSAQVPGRLPIILGSPIPVGEVPGDCRLQRPGRHLHRALPPRGHHAQDPLHGQLAQLPVPLPLSTRQCLRAGIMPARFRLGHRPSPRCIFAARSYNGATLRHNRSPCSFSDPIKPTPSTP